MSQKSQKALIADRVLLVGEDAIPRDVLEALEDQHLQIFLREPDLAQWPPEIHHLAQYLSREERIRWQIAAVMARHGSLLGNSLERWARAVWSDLTEGEDGFSIELELVLNEMVKYLEGQLVQYLETPSATSSLNPDS